MDVLPNADRSTAKSRRGYLFEFGDVKKLSEEIDVLLTNEKERKKMQKVNRTKAKQYLWENIVHMLEKVYLDL